jgi:hypothetical protein
MIRRSVLGLVGLIIFGGIAFAQQGPLAPVQGYDQRPPGTRPIESYEQRQQDQEQYQQPHGNIQEYSAPMPPDVPLISLALPQRH